MRPEALAALRGCDHIIHGGDICGAEVLEALAAIAPVSAVRGNNDQGEWAERLPEAAALAFGAVRVYVIHDIAGLAMDPAAEGFHAVVSGHSHKPAVVRRDGVLYVNPGSAGPRRFTLPVSVGFLQVALDQVRAELVELDVASGRRRR